MNALSGMPHKKLLLFLAGAALLFSWCSPDREARARERAAARQADSPLERFVAGASAGDSWDIAALARVHHLLSPGAVPPSGNRVGAREQKLIQRSYLLSGIARPAAEDGQMQHEDLVAFLREPDPAFVPDAAAALEWAQAAAASGNPDGLHTLGWMHYWGDGVQQDLEHARELWDQAAALGSLHATRDLARVLRYSEKPRDQQRAVKLVRDAAAAGVLGAHELLACALRDGSSGETDRDGALAALEEGVRIGCPSAMVELAAALSGVFPDWEGVATDTTRELQLLRTAASLEHPVAIWRITGGFSHGRWTALPAKEAVSLMERGAALGIADAASTLAACLAEGHGVRQDDALALRYYVCAYQLGDPIAALSCASFLLAGRGGQRDVGAAVGLLQSLVDGSYFIGSNKAWCLDEAWSLLGQVGVSSGGSPGTCTECRGDGRVPRMGLPPASLTAGQPSGYMTCMSCYGSGR